MMPSRGMHALKSAVPHIGRAQRRNFTLARHDFSRSHLSHRSTTSRNLWKVPGAIASAPFVRNASTTSTSVQDTPTTPLASPPSSPTQPDIDTLSLDDIDFSTTAISATEKVGYLKEIGLDYGWGPSSLLEWMMEHFHVTAGLPWWAAIVATGVTVRLATLPLYVKSTEVAARQRALLPLLSPIQRRIKEYRDAGNAAAAQQEMLKLMAVRKDAGIKLRWTFAPMVIQMVVGFCGFRILRAAAELPVPGFYTGGALWFTDLTLPDGYLLLPTMMAIMAHCIARLGGETGGTDQIPSAMKKFLLYGIPPMTFLFTGWQSAALCVWFTTTTFMSALTTLVIKNPHVRRLTGITQLAPRPTPIHPPKTLMERVKEAKDEPILGTLQRLAGHGPRTAAPREEETKPGGHYRAPTAYSRPVYQAPRIRSTKYEPATSIDAGSAQNVSTTLTGDASVSTPELRSGSVVSNVAKATTTPTMSKASGAGRKRSPRR